MVTPGASPTVVVMEEETGKLLVIGDCTYEDEDSWAEVFDPRSNSSTPVPSLPIECRGHPTLTASLRVSHQILVAFGHLNAAFVCDLTTDKWERFHQSDEFVYGKGNGNVNVSYFSEVVGDAAVAMGGVLLCWFHTCYNVIHAYHLRLKKWFELPIKGLNKVGKLFPHDFQTDCSLLPLDYNHLCLLWKGHTTYAQTDYPLLHCTSVGIYMDGRHRLNAGVVSSRSYVLKQISAFIEAVVLNSITANNSQTTVADVESNKTLERVVEAMAITGGVRQKGEQTMRKRELKSFDSLLPEEQRRSICFRTAHGYKGSIDFYCVPVDIDVDDDSADGTPPPPKCINPFLRTTNISRASSFAAVGKSMFCLGGDETTVNFRGSSAIYRYDTTGRIMGVWVPNSFDMCSARVAPSTVVMDGELFVIGGQVPGGGPLAEFFGPSSRSSLLVEPPPQSLCEIMVDVTAALCDRNQILMACSFEKVAYLLDVKTGAWDEFVGFVDFSDVKGEGAVVLKTTLCWYNASLHMLVAYDLELRRWFKKPIKDLKKVGKLPPKGFQTFFSLFPLDENHLCFLWIDHHCYAKTGKPLLHCTKVRVSLLAGIRFRAAVVSSRSYVLGETARFLDGLLLDVKSTPEEGSTSTEKSGEEDIGGE